MRPQELHKLIRDRLDSGGPFKLSVVTSSMSPLIRPNDTVTICKTPCQAVMCGDIIVYERDDDLYIHRFLYRKNHGEEAKLITKGDRAFVVDEPVSTREFLGRVISIDHRGREQYLDSYLWRVVNFCAGNLSRVAAAVYVFLRSIKHRMLHR